MLPDPPAHAAFAGAHSCASQLCSVDEVEGSARLPRFQCETACLAPCCGRLPKADTSPVRLQACLAWVEAVLPLWQLNL